MQINPQRWLSTCSSHIRFPLILLSVSGTQTAVHYLTAETIEACACLVSESQQPSSWTWTCGFLSLAELGPVHCLDAGLVFWGLELILPFLSLLSVHKIAHNAVVTACCHGLHMLSLVITNVTKHIKQRPAAIVL